MRHGKVADSLAEMELEDSRRRNKYHEDWRNGHCSVCALLLGIATSLSGRTFEKNSREQLTMIKMSC
jgi:hypothetical protein